MNGRPMSERVETMQRLRFHAVEAKRAIEAVMDILMWTDEPALSRALERLNELKEQASE